ncbi:MAG: hypothetical protein E6K22_15235 [Gammaproteobacteria bacterium]|nr:MAG: hypothetical protein E6K22_15235 [Gammaproteobacteria bacterium]TLZ62509.1 MAG: hypothetical protein E6K20_05580 [Gammaproteobacteria bacterium]
MSRLTELRARRADLLTRCAAQRADLARRIAELRPGAAGGGPEGAQAGGRGDARHPLGWLAVLAGLMLVTRAREVLSLLVFIRSAGELAVRAVQVLRLFGHRDAPRAAGAAAASPAAPAESRPGHA